MEQTLAQLQGNVMDATARVSGAGSGETSAASDDGENNVASNRNSRYRGAEGLDPELIAELEVLYGFDKPTHVRFFQMLGNYAAF